MTEPKALKIGCLGILENISSGNISKGLSNLLVQHSLASSRAPAGVDRSMGENSVEQRPLLLSSHLSPPSTKTSVVDRKRDLDTKNWVGSRQTSKDFDRGAFLKPDPGKMY